MGIQEKRREKDETESLLKQIFDENFLNLRKELDP